MSRFNKSVDIEKDFLGMKWQRWVVIDEDGDKQWSCRLWVWRLQIGLFIYRHSYPEHSDRWVIEPALVYDRKERSRP